MTTAHTTSSVLEKLVFDSEVSERKILVVPVATITGTPYNPAARTKEGVKLTRLINSVKQHGLVYPILITSDRNLIDGNRRLAACRALGHSTIECVVSDLDRDEAFTTVNTTSSAIGGKGWLEIAKGGGKLPAKEAKQYEELRAMVGAYGIEMLIKQKLGLSILPLCKSVASLGTKKRVEEIILLAATTRITNKLNAELRADKSQDKKVVAINKILREAQAGKAA